jgi:hypothetical protein
VADSKLSDKAAWKVAAKAIFADSLAGALEGEDEHPRVELDELRIRWSARPKFQTDSAGAVTVLADQDEPGVQAVEAEVVYKRNRTPKL